MNQPILVQKASGDVEEFSPAKLSKFLERIQVPPREIATVISQVQTKLTQKTSTHEIAHYVTTALKLLPDGDVLGARYNLKSAIRRLGPGGHVFEEYVGRLFEAEGYETEVSILVKGKCVTHEVDIVAKKDNCLEMIEAKFHNREGIKSDVTITMYTYARFLDLRNSPHKGCGFTEVWLATNTKPTLDALDYAKCQGMKILSVELPYGNSIMDRVMREGLFPISSIENLEPYLLQLYMNNHVMLRDVLGLTEEQGQAIGIPNEVLFSAKMQAKNILSYHLSKQDNSKMDLNANDFVGV
jgi:hypothetical protein